MIVLWMLYAAGLAGAAAVAALAADRALRLYGRPARWVWATSLGAGLLAPAAVWWLAGLPAPVAGATGVSIGAVTVTAAGSVPAAQAAGAAWFGALAWLRSVAAGAGPVVVWAWVAASVLLLLALGLSYLRLRRERADWAEGEVDGVPVLVSRDAGPAVVGLRRSRIVVPAWVLGEPESRRRLIVQHELEHLVAGDARLLASGLAALALMPWNPVTWWQVRRLRLAAELDCDARVLRRGADLHRYAGLLLDVGERVGGPGVVAAFAEPRSFLGRRLRAMTTLPPARRAWRAAAGAVLAGGALALAYCAPHPDRITAPSPTELAVTPADTAGADAVPTLTPYTVAPELTNRDEVRRALVAAYPPLLKEAGVGGTVHVWLLVSESGSVGKAQLHTSSGRPELDSAALAVARVMRFTPPRNGDKVVRAWIRVPIAFRTGEKADTATAVPVTRVTAQSLEAAPTFTPYTVAPELTNRDEVRRALVAAYPPVLKDAGIGGTVNVWLLLNESGSVDKTQLRATSGRPELDSAALAVARVLRFTPAMNRNQVVKVWIQVPIVFRTTPGADEPGSTIVVQNAGPGVVAPRISGYATAGLSDSDRALIRRVMAPVAEGARPGATVVVAATIDTSGVAQGIRVEKSSGSPEQDEEALAVLRATRWTPAHDGTGKVLEVTVVLPLRVP